MTDAEIAARTRIPVRVIQAIRIVESAGRDPHAIRFEPHLFLRHKPGAAIPYTPCNRPPAPHISRIRAETDRRAFDRAFTIDPELAVRSTSWGLWQDLGGALLAETGLDPAAAVAAFWGAPDGLSGRLFCRWVQSNPRILVPARANPPDFEGIARAYNGNSPNVPHYAQRLQAAYDAS